MNNKTAEQESRANNLILHHLPEQASDDNATASEKDMSQVTQMFTNHLGIQCDRPKSTTRLGIKTDRSRPLKVVMCSEQDKITVIMSARKLKDATEPFKTVSIASDMSREEREENRRMIEEAKRLDGLEQSGDFIHLVRGPPWRRRIIRVERRRKT